MNKPSILIVDDNEPFLKTVKDVLEASGFACTAAADGLHACHQCRKYSFDFVLMDVQMPGLNGFEVLKRIREKGINVPVIMMTAFWQDSLRQKAADAGAVSIIKKPIDFLQLKKILTSN